MESFNTVDGPKREVVLESAAQSESGAPPIVTRAEWGADETLKRSTGGCKRSFHPLQQIFVHHTAGSNYDYNGAATMRAIYAYHTQSRGWCDLGYNFVIDWSGTIYEGRWAQPLRCAGTARLRGLPGLCRRRCTRCRIQLRKRRDQSHGQLHIHRTTRGHEAVAQGDACLGGRSAWFEPDRHSFLQWTHDASDRRSPGCGSNGMPRQQGVRVASDSQAEGQGHDGRGPNPTPGSTSRRPRTACDTAAR